ncbi:MAG TPA: hypothetical protein VK177_02225 [Flavobacteriales bacterium]|nr:hypothetical protein [Flavobacteriales bacterium]
MLGTIKTKFIFVALFMLPVFAFAQKGIFIDTAQQDPYFLHPKDSLALKMDTISKKQFEIYLVKYKLTTDTNFSKIDHTDSSFTLKSDAFTRTYYADYKHYYEVNTYLGFIPELNLYIVDYVSGHNEIQFLNLVDAKTGKNYIVESPFDYGLGFPYLSPKANYLLSWVNNLYETNNSYLVVLKVKKYREQYVLEKHAEILSTSFEINNVVWINDKRFALSVTDKITNKALFLETGL